MSMYCLCPVGTPILWSPRRPGDARQKRITGLVLGWTCKIDSHLSPIPCTAHIKLHASCLAYKNTAILWSCCGADNLCTTVLQLDHCTTPGAYRRISSRPPPLRPIPLFLLCPRHQVAGGIKRCCDTYVCLSHALGQNGAFQLYGYYRILTGNPTG